MAEHTPGPWYWHVDSAGRVSLRTPDRGNLIVMDFVRKGMNDAAPRLAVWDGMNVGAPRERRGGILEPFNAEHPDARLIPAAPDLLDLVKQYASECGECAGAGITPDDQDCKECKFIRDVIAKAGG